MVKNLVEKEVMKKTKNYGIIGMLLAVLFVAMIYSYGTTPGISPLLPSPSLSPTPSISPSLSPSLSPTGTPDITPNPTDSPSPIPEVQTASMKTFSSIDELKDFLNATTQNGGSYWIGTEDSRQTTTGLPVPSPTTAPVPASVPNSQLTGESSTGTKDYSTTNIQVAGVDEADTVKTDGKYLYVIGNDTKIVYIIDANPQNAKILGKISFTDAYLSGIYLSQDGTKLAVLGTQQMPYRILTDSSGKEATAMPDIYPYYNSGSTFVYVYNLANKATPVLSRNFTSSGYYVNSRMIGNYIYNIVSEGAYLVNDAVTLPTVFSDSKTTAADPSKIYYANTSDTYYSYTTVASINIANDVQQPTTKTIMMGGAGNIYVSQTNIYITYPVSNWLTTSQPTPVTSKDITTSTGTISIMPGIWRPAWQGTSIYRVQVSGDSMSFVATGNVTGNVLNQYSMDESNGYFRIVTTAYEYENEASWNGKQQNNVYVLNMNLNVVGRLEDLATGENFHSARFMGNRLYMVTFLKTDPLFVIDLSQPNSPRVLGELVIPGYSDYLHPYDETHLIGLGKDAIASEETNFAWYQGLKLSLFDVSNINAPKEIAKYGIGDRGTSSQALYDPKAFLFNPAKNLLVIPVELYLIPADSGTSSTPTAAPTTKTDGSTQAILPRPGPTTAPGASQYGQFVWQGVYIFNVSVNDGFVLKGRVSQLDDAAILLANPSLASVNSYQWVDYNQFITRSLYIGNTLYTISNSAVQLNSLSDFATLARIKLN